MPAATPRGSHVNLGLMFMTWVLFLNTILIRAAPLLNASESIDTSNATLGNETIASAGTELVTLSPPLGDSHPVPARDTVDVLFEIFHNTAKHMALTSSKMDPLNLQSHEVAFDDGFIEGNVTFTRYGKCWLLLQNGNCV